MKKLILHVGFAKTGSSALQSWLAINQEKLAAQGYCYAGQNMEAKKYMINSGNAGLLFEFLSGNKNKLDVINHYFGQLEKAIISAEGLQKLDDKACKKINELASEYNIDILVIAYIRSAYDVMYSGYIQDVKRGNALYTFEECVENKKSFLLIDFYNKLSQHFSVDLIYYDSVRDNIAKPFCKKTGLDYDRLTPLSPRRVNRTLSHREIIVTQLFGKWVEESGLEIEQFSSLITDNLVNKYPQERSEVFCDPKILQKIEKKIENQVNKFNQEAIKKYGFELDILSDASYLDFIDVENVDTEVFRRVTSILCRNGKRIGGRGLRYLAKKAMFVDKFSSVKLYICSLMLI